ncbi:putative class III chitinase [Aspergillus fumigatus Af293]|uniref:chitinase n=1 Tax=Aspergillus fumigatus (strain ATCC MYA-4609 / CBS 101355 / FGSC A1100 / Af293) TaxID=330879 RepID=Q4WGI4_ASPFU|nr:class III chitinase, putative [Aspergillus fumigatus Af293]EAL86957.1 class III chitinase, putative [Aspergillus fumigatus Af293]
MALYKLGLWASLWATFHTAAAKLDLNSQTNIAIYWGMLYLYQYVVHPPVSPHSNDCPIIVRVFQLAFVTRINGANGLPEVNFANAGDNCTTFEGTNLLSCPQIEEDIPICQSLGKTILLSIGGATYTEGGFTSESAAIAGANSVWQTFGPPSNNPSTLRPFGKAAVDGFDLDFESPVANMPAFANQLRSLFSSDPSKQYYLTAAPQCPYPDAADGPMLDGAVSFDAIWVQFYNNYCGLQAYNPGSTSQNNFNFATWDTWAKSVSRNKNVKVFLGVPGSSTAAGSGYVSVEALAQIIAYTKGFSSFGGVMAWDVSQVMANSGFLAGVRAALGSGSGSGSGSTTVSPTTASTTTSTSTPTTTTSSTTSAPTTSTSVTTTSTTSSTTAPTGSCPTAGARCSGGGAACNGASFGLCDNGVWVMQPCPGGLVCIQGGAGVYCGYPADKPAGSC